MSLLDGLARLGHEGVLLTPDRHACSYGISNIRDLLGHKVSLSLDWLLGNL